MSVSRRGFVRTLAGRAAPAAPAPAWIGARGREAWIGEHGPFDFQAAGGAAAQTEAEAPQVRLSSNENPLGPSQIALRAIEGAFEFSGRYPMNARPAMADFSALVASKHGLEPANIALGAGSGEILDCGVRAFTNRSRGLVTATPTFETPTEVAKQMQSPLEEVPVLADGKLDLERMIAASNGAGLVFICNPNNPTATVYPAPVIADAVARIASASPDTVVMLDEAYHEYVTDPAYASGVSLIAQHPNLIVSRTMSKAHGMAGLRIGYAMGQPQVIERLRSWLMPYNVSAMAVAAAVASMEDEAGIERERARNTEAKQFTVDFFQSMGLEATDSQTNFLFVKLGRPAAGFRDACREQGILVGRDFPPMEKTHCRISIGTMEEMQRAVNVFKAALGA